MKKLPTGVICTNDKKGNLISVESPYHRNELPTQLTILGYLTEQIRKYLKG